MNFEIIYRRKSKNELKNEIDLCRGLSRQVYEIFIIIKLFFKSIRFNKFLIIQNLAL